MNIGPQLQDITHTIQLAVAPVFLLTAIGTTLSVLANRLGRIVDRARKIEARLAPAGASSRLSVAEELRLLEQRARLIHWALTSGTICALLVCLLIAIAFIGYLLTTNLGSIVAVLFIAAMVAYVAALLFFLREVFLAIKTLRFALLPEIDPEHGKAMQKGE